MTRFATSIALALLALWVGASTASAMTIEQIVSPSGIHGWLVREHAVPLVALNYVFHGGSTQDDPLKAGTAHLTADMLDEGAGDLDSKTYHTRLENRAIELSFDVGRDYFRGSLRTLDEHRDEAFDLLNLALTKPRFDADALERVRAQELSELRRETTNPNNLASRSWWSTAFPGHPYGRESEGTLESMARITADDLHDYVHRVFARKELTVSIVGDIDADTAGKLIDRAFGGLPADNKLSPVPQASPSNLGRRIVIDVNVPQAVVNFGGQGIARHDPDFMTAYVVNHILGGGSFSSRLYREVREKRGLAYGVSDQLVWFRRAAVDDRRHRHPRRPHRRRAQSDRGRDQAHGRERANARRARRGEGLHQGLLRALARYLEQDRGAAQPDPDRQSRHRLYPAP